MTVRFVVESLNEKSGSSLSPGEALKDLRLLHAVQPAQVDSTWIDICRKTLLVETLPHESGLRREGSSQIFIGGDLQRDQYGIIGNMYFIPHLRAALQGVSEFRLVGNCMVELGLSHGWQVLAEHLDSLPEVDRPTPTMVAIDCPVEPAKNRARVYIRVLQSSSSFNAIARLLTLGGQIWDQSLECTLSALRRLWELLFPGIGEDELLPFKRGQEYYPAGFVLYYEMAMAKRVPIPAMTEIFRSAVSPYPGVLPSSHARELFNNCDVSYGLPFSVSCAKHAEETFHAKRIFVIASSTLANRTSALDDLRASLGEKVMVVKTGLKSHTYFSDVLEIAEECRQREVDLIVTLGGGSLTDAAKMVSLALANGATQPDDLLKLPTSRTPDAPAKPPTVPVICITTTLSAGEFTLISGVTDDRDNKKHQFVFPHAIRLVIFDPALLTAHTPVSLLLQSGFRSVDHCVEGLCSLHANEVTELHATQGLKKLVPALLRCKADAEAKSDVDARLAAQLATIDAVAGGLRVYTPMGASHGIGHMLGPFGVGHGHTSCILLPAVCKYNKKNGSSVVAERQKKLVELLWEISEFRVLAESRALSEAEADLGDLLGALVDSLGMPRTLAEVGVGRDRFEQLAEYSLLDVCTASNPVPLTEKGQVLEILEVVAE